MARDAAARALPAGAASWVCAAPNAATTVHLRCTQPASIVTSRQMRRSWGKAAAHASHGQRASVKGWKALQQLVEGCAADFMLVMAASASCWVGSASELRE